jgi:hypothetical protein
MTLAIYREPTFNIKEGSTITNQRRQKAGIRQGCPLSPYFVICLLSAITFDVSNNLTNEQREIKTQGALHGVNINELYCADDTLIMASTAPAAQCILHRIEEESAKYYMKLNYTKCIHFRMNDLHRVEYTNGDNVPMQSEATYLR